MRRMRARSYTAIVAATLALPLLAAAPAQAAPTADLSISKTVSSVSSGTKIDESQLLTALNDVRNAGTATYLDQGLRIRTTGTADKVAQYWPQSGPLPSTASYAWTQEEGTFRPGMQIVFDADGILNNGIGDYNILVNVPTDNGSNWWLPPSASSMAKDAAPSCTSGGPLPDTDPDPVRVCSGLVNGRPWYGTLGAWITALPNAKMYAVGYSLGSGASGIHSGLITSMDYGDQHYVFGGYSSAMTALPGETVEYKLTVRNATGPSTIPAAGVQVTDVLPPELTYVDGSLIDNGLGCSFAGQVLTCSLGTVPDGVSTSIKYKAVVDDEISTAGMPIVQGHWVDVQKQETFADLPAGQTRTYETYCPTGYIATDGGLLIDAVDQGGSYADIQVRTSKPTSLGGIQGWTVTAQNTGLYRGQGKVKVTCLSSTMGGSGGHTHTITVSPSSGTTTATNPGPAASATVVRSCPSGYTPVAPAYDVTLGSVVVRQSWASGSTWTWQIDQSANSSTTFGLTCLPPRSDATGGHTASLLISTTSDAVALGAGTRAEGQITCADGGNGIVGGFGTELPTVRSLGMESRGITYMYRFHNAGPATAQGLTQLTCIGVRTATEPSYYHVINTALVTTTTPDASGTDNSSSADLAVNGDPTAAPPNGVTVDTTATRTVVLSKTTLVTLGIKCPAACSFTARLYYGGGVAAKTATTVSLPANPGFQSVDIATTNLGTYLGPGLVSVKIRSAGHTVTFPVTLL